MRIGFVFLFLTIIGFICLVPGTEAGIVLRGKPKKVVTEQTKQEKSMTTTNTRTTTYYRK